jgi:hypothetical protein
LSCFYARDFRKRKVNALLKFLASFFLLHMRRNKVEKLDPIVCEHRRLASPDLTSSLSPEALGEREEVRNQVLSVKSGIRLA